MPSQIEIDKYNSGVPDHLQVIGRYHYAEGQDTLQTRCKLCAREQDYEDMMSTAENLPICRKCVWQATWDEEAED